MKGLAGAPFGAIFRTEVLLNSKRVAPYAMAAFFAANAALWWGWGAAARYGWATNSDFYIVRNFGGFSFLTLPLFTAVIMGDPVIRDFRAGIAPLIFSKPVGRAAYLLGKFFGNFFVLVCCQAAFALTLLLLQGFRTSGMVVLPVRVTPYFKHFFFFVVVSHLALAAFYFTVGALSRNAKIVYGLGVSFYPLYAVYQVFVLNGLPTRWRVALDPLLTNWRGGSGGTWPSADWANHFVVSYSPDMIANRASMIAVAATCLAFLYLRFSKAERVKEDKGRSRLTMISLGAGAERPALGAESSGFARPAQVEVAAPRKSVATPKVATATEGVRASLRQLLAALGVELRLLFAERSVIVFVPLATLLCVVGLSYYEVAPGGSYSAAYAARTADSLLLFLCAVAVFYTGEAMHRDRELRFEPVLWSTPAPDFVLLLSKSAATLLLSISLCVTVGLTAIALQIYKGRAPVEVSAYLIIYLVILIPSAIFLIAAATALNVLLRDKHLAYAVSIAVGGGLFYLYSQGYNHWLYDPVLYGLWTPSDLTGTARHLALFITYRIYCLWLAAVCLALAHRFFERKSIKGFR